MPERRAFRVTVEGWDETAGIVIATSASKARYRAYLSAREAGWTHVTLQRLCIHRAPKYDPLAELVDHMGNPKISGASEDYADALLRDQRETTDE